MNGGERGIRTIASLDTTLTYGLSIAIAASLATVAKAPWPILAQRFLAAATSCSSFGVSYFNADDRASELNGGSYVSISNEIRVRFSTTSSRHSS